MNLFWTFYNLVVLGVAFSVGTELRQIRRSHRTAARLKTVLYLGDGQAIATHTLDFSFSGLALDCQGMDSLEPGTVVRVGLYRGKTEHTFQGRVIAFNENRLSLQMEFLDLGEEAQFVCCTFSRADAWSSWDQSFQNVGILDSIGMICTQSAHGYQRLLHYSAEKLMTVLKVA
jgi:cellulose synthase (UDP-forming)